MFAPLSRCGIAALEVTKVLLFGVFAPLAIGQVGIAALDVTKVLLFRVLAPLLRWVLQLSKLPM